MRGILALLVGLAMAVTVDAPATRAETAAGGVPSLRDSVDLLLESHRRIVAAREDVAAAEQRAKVAVGDWYPTFDVTSSYGYEEQQKKQNPPDTEMVPRVLDLSVTQLLWDFGATNSAISKARTEVARARAALEAARQGVLREAVTAHLGVVREQRILEFAKGSIANIKRQAQLETSRVERGSGLATDVLQAKTQLAGSEATRIQTAGRLRRAMNRYENVFNRVPATPEALPPPQVPETEIPATLEDALTIAHQENPQLKAAHLGVRLAKEEIERTRSDELYPTLNAIAERNHQKDEAGTVGTQLETLFKVELSYSLNGGLTEINTLKAARNTHAATYQRFVDAREQVEEQVRNAWDNLMTARANHAQLQNQANIAAEFLSLARRERQLGNRSLIDVLAGETALINAQSQAASAEIDIATAGFNLLAAMGRLTPDAILPPAGEADRRAETDVSENTVAPARFEILSEIAVQ